MDPVSPDPGRSVTPDARPPLPACLLCKDLRIGFPVHFDIPTTQLRQSAGNCPWCDLLLQAMRSIAHRFPAAAAARKLKVATAGSWSGLKIALDEFRHSTRLEDAHAELDWYEVYVVRDVGARNRTPSPSRIPSPRLRMLPQISGKTSSAEAVEWAQMAYLACILFHDCQGRDKPLLPTRILDVGRRGGSQDIKLHITRGERERYFCLSHCWGTAQPLTTTRETLDEHRGNIPWSQLPRTFQEAVTFTREMGVRYLWIDSLCIIQDDRDDWKKEASRMFSIYENADLTLSAAAAPDSQGGCFATPPSEYVGWAVPYRNTRFWVRRQIDHQGLLQNGSGPMFHGGGPCPLVTRAWVFQERLLSPRVLHFSRHELVFECNGGCICECEAIDNSYIWHKKMWNKMRTGADTAQRTWAQILMAYTKLNITNPSDRLPALAGIVGRIKQKRTGRYVAGLWEETIVSDLLWHVATSRPKPSTRYAPSWSWASV